MNHIFIIFISVTVLFLIEIVLRVIIKRNKYKSELKRNAKNISAAKIQNFKTIPGRPTIYIVDVEYEENQNKKKRRIITHGKFARKYEYEEEVRRERLLEEVEKIYREQFKTSIRCLEGKYKKSVP